MAHEPVTTEEFRSEMSSLKGYIKEQLIEHNQSLRHYMQEGFEMLDSKIDYVYEQLSYRCDGLERRIDDLADNKVSRIEFKKWWQDLL